MMPLVSDRIYSRRFCVLIVSLILLPWVSGQQKPLTITSPNSFRSMAGEPVQIQLTATGGTGPYTWTLLQSQLPNGLHLDPRSGLITGTSSVSGEVVIPLGVTDSSRPAQQARTDVTFIFFAALEVKWRKPAEAHDGGISGSVVVTNNTARTLNLTVIVLAVNEINKAFALGYQHFDCKPNADTPVIPFGSSLPFGGYIVHVDAVAEDAPKNRIYRSRLQTRNRLTLQQQP